MPAGIQFTETMRGYFSSGAADDYADAEARGQRDGTKFEFTVTVTSDDLDAMLTNPDHQARIDGAIECPALSPSPLRVANGIFKLLVRDPTRVNARLMTYQMIGLAQDGAAPRGRRPGA